MCFADVSLHDICMTCKCSPLWDETCSVIYCEWNKYEMTHSVYFENIENIILEPPLSHDICIVAYCLFHVTLPMSQSQHILYPIFEVLYLAQYYIELSEILYIVLYMYYLGAPSARSSNFFFWFSDFLHIAKYTCWNWMPPVWVLTSYMAQKNSYKLYSM